MSSLTFWSGKRVLLTGHTGFKGGWLTLMLGGLGAKVTGLSLSAPTIPSLFDVAGVADGITSLIGDITNRVAVAEAFETARPEIVFHLAAQPIVRHSYDDPVTTYMTNVMGTVHVLEAARRSTSVHSIVVVTSDKCYENPESDWGCREGDPMGGHDPYSSSKGCTELLTSAFRRSYFAVGATASHAKIGLATARAGNVIGGGDWARDRLIPDIVRSIDAKQSVAIRNPTAVRPWQHVLEPLTGYLQLAERLWHDPTKYGGGWNFGPTDQDARPVREVVQLFCDGFGQGARWHIEADHKAPHEAHLLHLDTTKARSRLDWRPRWTLGVGVAATASWYRQFLHGADMRKFTIAQIGEFQNSTRI